MCGYLCVISCCNLCIVSALVCAGAYVCDRVHAYNSPFGDILQLNKSVYCYHHHYYYSYVLVTELLV